MKRDKIFGEMKKREDNTMKDILAEREKGVRERLTTHGKSLETVATELLHNEVIESEELKQLIGMKKT